MYKIRHKITGLYSMGGREPTFHKKGKVWSGINHVRSHLTLVKNESLLYGEGDECDEMKNWADDFVKKNNIDRDVSVYYGITTKSISQKIEFIDQDSGQVNILVNTLRRESGGSLLEDFSFYQEALVSFVLEKGFWKVNSANWK